MILGIYGSGGAGREVRDIASELNRWEEIVFIDDTVPEGIFEDLRRMPFENFRKCFDINKAEIIIALGEPKYKVMLYNKIKNAGYRFATIIHRMAWVSPSAHIGNGVVLRAGAVINANAYIGDNVTIQEQSCVGHDTRIGDHCQIAGMVVVGGHSEIGEATYIGLGVPIKDMVKIGSNSVIGMGSVVIRDIPDNVVAIGNPARAMRPCDDNTRVFK